MNQDDEKIPEGFSWDKYVPGSDLAMMAEIVEEPEPELRNVFLKLKKSVKW